MNIWFASAAGVSAFTCLTHLIVGGRVVAGPLLRSDLAKVPKFTAYYCWHLVTIMLAGIALAFAIAATHHTEITLAAFATGAAVLFCAWSLAMIALFRLKLWHFPQWFLFLPAEILGLAGLT